jgi:hypothetical protein
MMSFRVIPSTRSAGQRQIYQRRRLVQNDDSHQRQGNLSGTMTVDGAQIGLAATVAATFTASIVIFLLRVYARRRLEGRVCSDWVNGRPGSLHTLAALADIVCSFDIRSAPSHAHDDMTANIEEGHRPVILDSDGHWPGLRPREACKLQQRIRREASCFGPTDFVLGYGNLR